MSSTKQETRAAETRKRILHAAQSLFVKKGYERVTMREIAKKAGCSHTAIYLYYNDKESLLEHTALPHLEKLYEEFQQITTSEKPPLTILQKQCRLFVEFGLENQTLYPVYFTVKAERVDHNEPKLHINRIRNALFHMLNLSVQKALDQKNTDASGKASIDHARITFYQLHGMIMTYMHSEEPVQEIKKRVLPLVELGVEALIRGLKE